jgi:arginine decarboxylase
MLNGSNLVPRHAFFIKGAGRHVDHLQAFDIALREAGPLVHNLVTVSSILPAGCKIITKKEGIAMLTPGEITFCVMARQESNIPGEVATASIGTARLKNEEHYGFISEHHGIGQSEEEAARYAEKLAVEMFAFKLGISGDQLTSIESSNTTQSAAVGPEGEWVCAVALCVFVM